MCDKRVCGCLCPGARASGEHEYICIYTCTYIYFSSANECDSRSATCVKNVCVDVDVRVLARAESKSICMYIYICTYIYIYISSANECDSRSATCARSVCVDVCVRVLARAESKCIYIDIYIYIYIYIYMYIYMYIYYGVVFHSNHKVS